MSDELQLDAKTRISRNPEILATELEEETVMMNINNGQYYNLTAVGSDVWNMIEQPTEFGAVLEKLQQEYDVDPSICEKEVREFLGDMAVLGIVHCE